jgi:hypothetical protein
VNIKAKPDITVNIARALDDSINMHHRDGKRILQRKVWNSRKIKYDGDSFVLVWLFKKWLYLKPITWLLKLEDLKNGETRVTPMYEVEFVKHSHRVSTNNDDIRYKKFKKK